MCVVGTPGHTGKSTPERIFFPGDPRSGMNRENEKETPLLLCVSGRGLDEHRTMSTCSFVCIQLKHSKKTNPELLRSWRNGPAGKRVYCSCRGPEMGSQHSC